jgi:alkyldihydroxyacetonephosphate synthase
VRALAQSALYPTNCRLLDPLETVFSASRRWQPRRFWCLASSRPIIRCSEWMRRALELVRDHGGEFDADAVARSMAARGQATRTAAARPAPGALPSCACPTGATRRWACGVIMDTFETAITWDKFDAFYAGVKRCAVSHRY